MKFKAFAVSAVVAALVASFIAPIDPYFLENLFFLWLPMMAVLLLATVLGAGPPGVFGVAVGICVYLALFHLWVLSVPSRESGLAWVFYYFSMPGAFLGAGASALWTKARPSAATTTVFLAFLGTSGGLALNVSILYFSLP